MPLFQSKNPASNIINTNLLTKLGPSMSETTKNAETNKNRKRSAIVAEISLIDDAEKENKNKMSEDEDDDEDKAKLNEVEDDDVIELDESDPGKKVKKKLFKSAKNTTSDEHGEEKQKKKKKTKKAKQTEDGGDSDEAKAEKKAAKNPSKKLKLTKQDTYDVAEPAGLAKTSAEENKDEELNETFRDEVQPEHVETKKVKQSTKKAKKLAATNESSSQQGDEPPTVVPKTKKEKKKKQKDKTIEIGADNAVSTEPTGETSKVSSKSTANELIKSMKKNSIGLKSLAKTPMNNRINRLSYLQSTIKKSIKPKIPMTRRAAAAAAAAAASNPASVANNNQPTTSAASNSSSSRSSQASNGIVGKLKSMLTPQSTRKLGALSIIQNTLNKNKVNKYGEVEIFFNFFWGLNF